MEYEFSQDLLGAPVAQFSMGHEAFGFWLEDEMRSTVAIDEVLSELGRLQRQEAWEFERVGREYSLMLSSDDAQVAANVLALAAGELDDDALALSDEGQTAACGLEDFAAMLSQWQQFVASIRQC